MKPITITDRDKAIWRAAITLANNLCVRASDRENERDGSCNAIAMATHCARGIRAYVEPTNEELEEMFKEAGVPDR